MSRSILLVEDDPAVAEMLRRFLERRDWTVAVEATGAGALEAVDRDRPDLVVLDIHLPDASGLDLLPHIQQRDADAAIVILTGDGDIAKAVEAMRRGAENFLTKPVDLTHLDAALERAHEKVDLRRHSRFLAARTAPDREPWSLGGSPAMRDLERRLALVAASGATVLLLGETGVGKTFVARRIHALSPRAQRPFVDLNCAGLNATFLESELFGHEKGAFTDAKAQKHGLFEIADGGTLFLDEIGDLGPELQPKLLKALEDKRFRRLGGTRELQVDVRLVAATNRDLEAAVRAGSFREDLYYRLATVPIRIPPLRDRGPEAVAALALPMFTDLRRTLGRGPERLAADTLALLGAYSWPGNIRELRSVVERALILAGDADLLLPHHLPHEIIGALPDPSHDPADLPPLHEIERRYLARVLAHHDGNRSRAARTLGISRVALYDKMRRFGLAAVGRP